MPLDDALTFSVGIYSVKRVPYQHAIQRLPTVVDENVLSSIYQDLLSHLSLGQESPHNLVLVKNWIMVIPRRIGRIGVISANAVAMLGMVWVNLEEEYEKWTKEDPMTWLQAFGVPVEADSK